jgi:hypothetical protein
MWPNSLTPRGARLRPARIDLTDPDGGPVDHHRGRCFDLDLDRAGLADRAQGWHSPQRPTHLIADQRHSKQR